MGTRCSATEWIGSTRRTFSHIKRTRVSPDPSVDMKTQVMESKRLALSGTSAESMTFALFQACVAAWNAGLKCKHTSCSRLDLEIPDPTQWNSLHTLSSSQLRNLAPMLAGVCCTTATRAVEYSEACKEASCRLQM